ncbi:hypothetical protein D3C87_297350 [compost metagenome]
MKKNFFLILFTVLSSYLYSQTKINVPTKFPTEYGKFTFSLGSKITLELKEIENNKYEYKVLAIEPIKGYYDLDKNEDLFSKKPQKNTVELFFMGAFYNGGKEDKDWKSVLLLRNNLEKPITYKADIKYYFSDKFENTSIVGAFPKTATSELWGHKIDYITLYGFEKLK